MAKFMQDHCMPDMLVALVLLACFGKQTRMRYYRNALVALGRAIDHFRAEKVEFVLQLGDVIDGKCQHTAKGSVASMDAVMSEFHRLDCPSYHVRQGLCCLLRRNDFALSS
jgi:hypothetical protein